MSKTQKSIAILLLGPPGSGKGTHGTLLQQHLLLPHISTGDLLREHVQKNTFLGKAAKAFLDKGSLVPDELVSSMLLHRISLPDAQGGYILDGFPRTLPQAESLDREIGASHEIVALYFAVAEEILVERITGRLSCPSCKQPYHRTFAPPKTPLLCDQCQVPLASRKDDTPELLRERLLHYHSDTKPLLAYYHSKDQLFSFSGEGPREIILQKILSHPLLAKISPLSVQ